MEQTIKIGKFYETSTQTGSGLSSFIGKTKTAITAEELSKAGFIGDSAFINFSNLTTVHIPVNITEIKQYVFSGCTSLTNFYYLGTKAEWKVVKKGLYWRQNAPFTAIHCSDGDF